AGPMVPCAPPARRGVRVHPAFRFGLASPPPAYPDSTFSTPRSCSYTASRHQKHPPPRVATSVFVSAIGTPPFLQFPFAHPVFIMLRCGAVVSGDGSGGVLTDERRTGQG